MFQREKFSWAVVASDVNGEVVEGVYSAYWSPEKVESHIVAAAFAAEISVASKQKFLPVSASPLPRESERATDAD